MIDNESLKKLKESLESYTPLIPDPIIDHFLQRAGISHTDKSVKKFISLLAQKFITDVSISALQYHKITQKSQQKDKRFTKEKKITFVMGDLEKALEEIGIDIGRPYYYT